MAVPDVVIEVVPLLPLGHREGQFPGHGSDAAAGQVSEPGLGERHTWQHRDTHKHSELCRPRELPEIPFPVGYGHRPLPT